MAREYSQQYLDARDRIKRCAVESTTTHENGKTTHHPGFVDPDDADRILRMADSYDPNKFTVETPAGQKAKSVTTLKNYLTGLKKVAEQVALAETNADELNALMQAFRDGDVETIKDSGLSSGSVRVYQNALRQFYYVFDDVGVDTERIVLAPVNRETVDPVDMLTRDEIQAIRDAATCVRDLALFDFLLYTGQRNTATRSLRVKDLDLTNSRFRLNPDADGLKGAEKNGKWRDLLLSAATVRQYLQTEHPAGGDPDAYVFVSRPKYGGPKPHTMLDVTTLGSIVGKMADRAAAEVSAIASKPTYPHALRHNFVTIALRRGMAESSIKHQIGHRTESTVMETTYAHLKDSDHIRAAREAFDLDTEAVESVLVPDICPRCGEDPPANARMCHWCGLAFTPDAREFVEDTGESAHELYRAVNADADEAAETVAKIQQVDDLLNDPAVRQALLNRAGKTD